MKYFNTLLVVAALTLAPVLANAQWSAVRFDSMNTYLRIYAATQNDVFALGAEPSNGEHFILRSDDGGTTWDSIALNTGADDFQMYEIYFANPTNGFIGGRKMSGYQNMQKTTDNGTTWIDITPDPLSMDIISSIYFLDANIGWATAGQSLYTTINGGTSWTTSDINFIAQDIYFQNTLDGFASGGDTMGTTGYVMRTVDGGLTWTPSLTNNDMFVFVNSDLFLNVVDANTIFTSQEWTNKLYRTINGGATWDTIVCDSAQQIIDFHFESADSGHVLTSLGQLYYTNDAGATWNLAYTAEWGLYGPSVYFYSLNFSQGIGYVCGTSGLIKRFDLNLLSVQTPLEITGSLNVFPSPCSGAQNITVQSDGMKGDCSLWIMNTLGEMVYFENVQNIESRSSIIVNSTLLATGSYTVVIHNDVQKQTAKLIIAE